MLIENSLRFHNFYDHVHIDEKRFFIDTDRKHYYLAKDEAVPHRTAQSKRFLTKVMFLTAVARPRYDTARNKWFNGRIGLWPFVEQRAARRDSANRPKGTIETKTVVVNRVEMRKKMLEDVIPAIKALWPGILFILLD